MTYNLRKIFAAYLIMAVAIIACGSSSSQPPKAAESSATPNLALTTELPTTEPPTFTPVPTRTPTPSPVPPMITVSENTICRDGPSKDYDIKYILPRGQSAEVVGKNSILHYWIIVIPGQGRTCWLWDKYATLNGSTVNVPEYNTPAPILTEESAE